MPRCPHVPIEHAQRVAPVACHSCLAFVDRDLSLMNGALAKQRYPASAAIIDAYDLRYQAARQPAAQQVAQKPDVTGAVLKASTSFLMILIALPVLVVLAVFTYTLLSQAAS